MGCRHAIHYVHLGREGRSVVVRMHCARRDTLKITISQMHDNVACVYFIHITPNHQCANFVNYGRMVTPQITATVIHQMKT